jgi:nitrate/nitrite-specific signal transduction histidine kinase
VSSEEKTPMLQQLIRRSGLRAKIIVWFLIPTAIILSAVAGLSFYASQRVTEDLGFERNRDRTRLLANQLSADLAAYQEPLRSLAAKAEPAALYRQQVTLDREWPGGELRAFDAGVLVLDGDGVVQAAVPDAYHLFGEPLPDLVASPSTASGANLGFTDLLFDRFADQDVIALAYPIADAPDAMQGSVVGLFHAERGATRTSVFYRNIWNLYIGRQETAFLVDGDGRVIFHPDTFFIGDDFSHLKPVQRALNREANAIRATNIEGRDVVVGFAPVHRTAWALVTEEPWSEIIRTSRPYTRFMLALLALGVVVPVVVVALGVRRITDPIAEMIEAARRIAGGDFGQTIDVDTGDELETLAEQFNAMSTELEASYAHLEQRVADRTQELATLNAISAVVSRSLALDETMDAALEKTLETMDLEAGAAFRLNGPTLNLMAHRGLSDQFVRRVEELPLRDSIASQAVGEAAPVARPVDDYPEGPLKALLQEEELQTVVSVPLTAKGQTLGVLNLATHTSRTLTPAERSLLTAIGQQTGVAVENARLYEQAEASAAAAERNRLARELHDAVSQTLFSASMIADVLPRLWERDPEEAQRRLAVLRRLTRGAVAEMRTLLVELRPSALLDADLGELLRQLGQAASGRAELEVDFEIDSEIDAVSAPPPDVKVALYRIAQEALNNVVKHAQADHVTVSLQSTAQGLRLSVRDDGRGFDRAEIPAGHFGLGNMRERAEAVGARLELESEPGQGTWVIVSWRETEGRI